jgi:hypothetical protein
LAFGLVRFLRQLPPEVLDVRLRDKTVHGLRPVSDIGKLRPGSASRPAISRDAVLSAPLHPGRATRFPPARADDLALAPPPSSPPHAAMISALLVLALGGFGTGGLRKQCHCLRIPGMRGVERGRSSLVGPSCPRDWTTAKGTLFAPMLPTGAK